ncbi:MAG: hypothetical protein AB1416_05090 [Actinomycetota bacterium]
MPDWLVPLLSALAGSTITGGVAYRIFTRTAAEQARTRRAQIYAEFLAAVRLYLEALESAAMDGLRMALPENVLTYLNSKDHPGIRDERRRIAAWVESLAFVASREIGQRAKELVRYLDEDEYFEIAADRLRVVGEDRERARAVLYEVNTSAWTLLASLREEMRKDVATAPLERPKVVVTSGWPPIGSTPLPSPGRRNGVSPASPKVR